MAKNSLNLNSILGLTIVLIFLGLSYIGVPPLERAERGLYDAAMGFAL